MQNERTFLDIPLEILLEITIYLDVDDFLSLALVNRASHRLFQRRIYRIC
jgi:hypothetical protein